MVYAYIYTQCLQDASFKQKFLDEPENVVRSLGWPLLDNFTIAVHEDTDTERFFTIPAPPAINVSTHRLPLQVEAMANSDVNANVNVNVNAQVDVNVQANVNADVTANAALQVNGAAVATVVVAVAVLI